MNTTPRAGAYSSHILVPHNAAAHRFEVMLESDYSVVDYEEAVAGGPIIFTRTSVLLELRGRGVAEKLVRTASGRARAARAR